MSGTALSTWDISSVIACNVLMKVQLSSQSLSFYKWGNWDPEKSRKPSMVTAWWKGKLALLPASLALDQIKASQSNMRKYHTLVYWWECSCRDFRSLWIQESIAAVWVPWCLPRTLQNIISTEPFHCLYFVGTYSCFLFYVKISPVCIAIVRVRWGLLIR